MRYNKSPLCVYSNLYLITSEIDCNEVSSTLFKVTQSVYCENLFNFA